MKFTRKYFENELRVALQSEGEYEFPPESDGSSPRPFPGKAPIKFYWKIRDILQHGKIVDWGLERITPGSFLRFHQAIQRETIEHPRSAYRRVYVVFFDQNGIFGIFVFSRYDSDFAHWERRATVYLPFLANQHLMGFLFLPIGAIGLLRVNLPFRWEILARYTRPGGTSSTDMAALRSTMSRYPRLVHKLSQRMNQSIQLPEVEPHE